MGGSAIGADFASKCFKDTYSKPIFILRDYELPGWVTQKTFVIVSSYSGNTEETLTAYKSCLMIGCNSIAISTGGILSQIATKNKVGLIKIPKGFQPRAAIGYSLSLILLIFEEIGIISNIKNKSSPEEMIKDLEIKMKDAAANLEFEEAAKLRDTIRKLEHKHLGLKLK